MAMLVKSIQERFKKKKEKENAAFNTAFNLLITPQLIISFASQNTTSSYTHMATAMADITDYDLCASFIADNGSDSHVINRFY